MGQEQSSEQAGGLAIPEGEGVHFVVGTGSAESGRGEAEKLLDQSRSLPVPQPLLRPPPREDVSSALQGAQMMYELRSRIGELISTAEEKGLLPSSGEKQPSSSHGSAELTASFNTGDPAGEDDDRVDKIIGKEGQKQSSVDEFVLHSEADIRAEQEKWARLGLDYEAVKSMVDACTSGKEVKELLHNQKELMALIVTVYEKSVRLKEAMDANNYQARKTTKAIEGLDKINVSLSEVQESLESAVATANILGASHFAHDDEMCSFKNFLKYHPPRAPE
ncbi:hypothetical protein BWQ96_03972 [Gracilariopsis chorda]|uniref:Uncharacterized protein n=1 Tax=Gracilariopsis chorda TaxID=448386 RepID=A0A2V3IVZ1_9FLOR|nr:hypothetical protein BWQ96_03972 [Gracilariopsis chorda]|eukprot:PXF46316.1 hypothetical protein BWQ96_03972 [Gracilariopsis chorda]